MKDCYYTNTNPGGGAPHQAKEVASLKAVQSQTSHLTSPTNNSTNAGEAKFKVAELAPTKSQGHDTLNIPMGKLK